ncbi:MAG: DUF819 family protein [Deltaproteobacteria bacterium]|nr:DUF819 family protein [Deltaproteobacteria bacterium]
MFERPEAILAVLLLLLALLFASRQTKFFARIYGVVPLLVFAYFLPTALSNTGIIPMKSTLYDFIKRQLLPASLLLMVLSVDVPAVLGLGREALLLFLGGTAGIVIGGPLAYFALGRFLPARLGDQAWKGLAAIAGSWIGGGANFVAIGEAVGTTDATLGMMIVVDVAIANIWMAVLLFFAGREEALDRRIAADRSSIDRLRQAIETFTAEVARSPSLSDLTLIAALAFGGTYLAQAISPALPQFLSAFTWVVILVTTLALGISFTPLRRLEGAGASRIGSLFLYLLVASIGAKAEFRRIADAPALVAVGGLWMTFHAATILTIRRLLKAPIFFAAVGSQANVGGAASAPIVAAAFHPALAPVGILLAVAGYVLGTYAGLLCAWLLRLTHGLL